MKRVLLIVFILLFISEMIYSQSFLVNIDSTDKSDTLGSEIIFDFKVQNTSDSDLTLAFIRTMNELPESWSSSLCFNFCFAPQLDTIVTSAQYGSSQITPGDTTNFSVHVFPIDVEGEAQIRIKIINVNNLSEFGEYLLTVNTAVTKVENDLLIGNRFELFQNYPNPFNPNTTIDYNIPHSLNQKDYKINDNLVKVQITVSDLLGKKVGLIIDEFQKPGNYSVKFDASKLASGVYFYSLTMNGISKTKKMILGK